MNRKKKKKNLRKRQHAIYFIYLEGELNYISEASYIGLEDGENETTKKQKKKKR